MTAKIYSRGWGNPSLMETQRELAKRFGTLRDDTPHGLLPHQIDALTDKGEQMLGSVTSPRMHRNALLESALPPGRSPDMRRQAYGTGGSSLFGGGGGAGGFGGGGGSFFTTMRPYQPEFESPDRQMFPIHRRQANSYWRLFTKMDPVIGSVIDMFSELPWSDFQLTGEGVDGEPKEMMEAAITETKLKSLFKYFVSEFMTVGEVIPHLFWDDHKGMWTHCALHNPDNINVVYSPFIKMNTLMEFIPDPKLREIATSTHPMLSRVRETMPSELLAHLQSGENIPLSPVNASFIPRRLAPYDLRGTSILSRLWRTLMLEDAIWSATIQTARRAAAPLKVAKLGDPTSGTIVDRSEEQRVLQLLAQAEVDPQAWLVYNYQIQFEMAGAPERIMSINQHYDLIERIKLVALGVSKSFVSGETSYSSAASGLTVFLQRLKAIRDFFVNEWLIPRFFLPMAIMNQWVKPSKGGEDKGHVRVKRSAKEMLDENLYIIPTIEWSKSLDPQVDKERLDAMQALEQGLMVKISDQKKYAAMGLDHEEEQKQIVEEFKFKRDLAGDDPALQVALGLAAPGGEGGGMGGMGAPGALSPGIPPDAFGMPGGEDMGGPPPGGDMGAPPGGEPAPEGASLHGDQGAQAQPADEKKTYAPKHWSESTLTPVLRAFDSFDPKDLEDDDPWYYALKEPEVQTALKTEDPQLLWEAIEGWLIDENYPRAAIEDLHMLLRARGKVRRADLHGSSLDSVLTALDVTVDDSLEFMLGVKNESASG